MTVTDRVRELLATRVDTFEKLDLIIALATAPHHALGIDPLAERMGCSRATVRQTIGELRRVMLVDLNPRGEAQLTPVTEGDRKVVDELLELYRADRSLLVQMLSEQSLRRIRGMAAQAFSDAFVLGRKKGKPDG